MLNEIVEDAKDRMGSSLTVFEADLQGIRGNRASTAIVDRLIVSYYGQEMEMRKIANISTPEAMTIMIRPFDPGAVAAIEAAINQANIGVNPNTDSGIIRLNMPALTKERRKELTKLLGKRTEDARVSVRNIRRDAISDIKELEKEGEASEDDSKRAQDQVESLTKEFVGKIDEASKVKEKDILEV